MCIYFCIMVFVEALPEAKPEGYETTNDAVYIEVVVAETWILLCSDVVFEDKVNSKAHVL